MTISTPAVASGRWKRFAAALISPTGRWVIAAFTALLIGADLVAVGPGFVAAATAIALGILFTPLITKGTHERGLSGLVGALIALYIILILEIYLGSTGLRFGPIGAVGRGRLALVDTEIIRTLNILYKHASALKSALGGAIFVIVYWFVHRFEAKFANWLNNVWAGVGGFVVVVLMFPFAQGFEVKQVAFMKATFDATSSLTTLGAFETAQEKAIKENEALRVLVAELRDETREQERQALVQAIRTYAKLLLQLEEAGQARSRILYKPDTYESKSFLALPRETYPPQPEREVAAAEGSVNDDVSAISVAHAEALTVKRDKMLDDVKRLRHERDAALTAIRVFVGNQVNAELAQNLRSDIADDARSVIVQVMVLRNMADATSELQSRIAELRQRIATVERNNQSLTAEVDRYRQFRLAYLRRDTECAAIRRAVLTWLTGQRTDLIPRFTDRWERAAPALRRDRPSVNVQDPPRGLDQEALERSVTEELRREGSWPPEYTEGSLTRDLIQVNETTGGTLSSFIDSSCRAQRDAARIEADLIRIANELPSPLPNPNLR